jgi:hypothetical protein
MCLSKTAMGAQDLLVIPGHSRSLIRTSCNPGVSSSQQVNGRTGQLLSVRVHRDRHDRRSQTPAVSQDLRHMSSLPVQMIAPEHVIHAGTTCTRTRRYLLQSGTTRCRGAAPCSSSRSGVVLTSTRWGAFSFISLGRLGQRTPGWMAERQEHTWSMAAWAVLWIRRARLQDSIHSPTFFHALSSYVDVANTTSSACSSVQDMSFRKTGLKASHFCHYVSVIRPLICTAAHLQRAQLER